MRIPNSLVLILILLESGFVYYAAPVSAVEDTRITSHTLVLIPNLVESGIVGIAAKEVTRRRAPAQERGRPLLDKVRSRP
jgi:hypothetical protein